MKINEIVQSLGYYTTADTAELIGKSEDTLRRWKRNGTFIPTHFAEHGQLRVDCYSPEDIVALLKIAKDIHPGRKSRQNPPPMALVSSW